MFFLEMKKMTDITSWLREQAANDFTCEAKLIEAAETIEHWKGHAERLRQDCEFHLAEIDRLKAITWAQAGEIDRMAAENHRLVKQIQILQGRLYLNKLPHDVLEGTDGL